MNLKRSYSEIKRLASENKFADVFLLIKEVEKQKLAIVAESESKNGVLPKIIGRGLEYTVYSMTNGRVRKRPNTVAEQNDVLLSWCIDGEKRRNKIIESINNLSEISVELVQEILAAYRIHKSLLGSPVFKKNGSYTQNKIVTLDAYFENHNISENEKVVDKYVEFVHHLWMAGMCDGTFKFLENNGINNEGDLVQLDFGEMIFTKEKVISLIESKKWLSQNFRFIADESLKLYIEERFEQELTLSKLEKFWPERFINSDKIKKWEELYNQYSKSWA